MKKFLVAALAVCSLSLVSCGSKKDEATKATEETNVEATTATTDATPAAAFDFAALGIDAENVNMDAFMEQAQKAYELLQSSNADLGDDAEELLNQATSALGAFGE